MKYDIDGKLYTDLELHEYALDAKERTESSEARADALKAERDALEAELERVKSERDYLSRRVESLQITLNTINAGNISLRRSLSEAFNSGDGSYTP